MTMQPMQAAKTQAASEAAAGRLLLPNLQFAQDGFTAMVASLDVSLTAAQEIAGKSAEFWHQAQQRWAKAGDMLGPDDRDAGRRFVTYAKVEADETVNTARAVMDVSRSAAFRMLGVWLSACVNAAKPVHH